MGKVGKIVLATAGTAVALVTGGVVVTTRLRLVQRQHNEYDLPGPDDLSDRLILDGERPQFGGFAEEGRP